MSERTSSSEIHKVVTGWVIKGAFTVCGLALAFAWNSIIDLHKENDQLEKELWEAKNNIPDWAKSIIFKIRDDVSDLEKKVQVLEKR